MWKKLLIISIIIIVICPVLSHGYYVSKYENQTIIRGDVVGGLEFHGTNQLMLKHLNGVGYPNWIARVDGIDSFSFQKGETPYNFTEYNCSNLTIAPSVGKNGVIFTNNYILDGIISFNEMQSSTWYGKPAKGYDIEYMLLKGVSGELGGTMENRDGMDIRNVVISFKNQTVISDTDVENDYIRFNSSGPISVAVTLFGNDTLLVNMYYNIVWSQLNGKLEITDFQGTVVSGDKIFFGDLTIEGKEISIRTIQYAYHGSTAFDSNDDPSRYWSIEVTFSNGSVSGYYYPFWSIGVMIGIVAVTVVDVICYIYWWTKKHRKVIEIK